MNRTGAPFANSTARRRRAGENELPGYRSEDPLHDRIPARALVAGELARDLDRLVVERKPDGLSSTTDRACLCPLPWRGEGAELAKVRVQRGESLRRKLKRLPRALSGAVAACADVLASTVGPDLDAGAPAVERW